MDGGAEISSYRDTLKTEKEIDSCLGMISSLGEYHYSSMSSCILGWYDTTKPYVTDGQSCSNCFFNMKSSFESNRNIKVVGIAKDGRVIYGPVKSYDAVSDVYTEYSPCMLDVCNGRIEEVNSEKIYTYHATSYHPYLPACFGPGQYSVPSNFQ